MTNESRKRGYFQNWAMSAGTPKGTQIFKITYAWTTVLKYPLKWFFPIVLSSPRAQPEVVLFWCQMKTHIFSHCNPKFQLQIHYTLEVIAENVYLFPIYQFWFIYVFSLQPHPQGHFLIFSQGEKIRSNFEVKLYKMCLRDQSRSVKSENTHVKMDTTLFNTV